MPYLERTIEWAHANGILWLEAIALRWLSTAILEQGRPREGSELRRRLEAIRDELGTRVGRASAQGEWSIGELELDAEGLEERVRTGYETLKALGERGFLSTVSANLAQVLYWRGKYEEAEALAVESESLGADEDVATQVGWRAARAMLLGRRGRIREAEVLAGEAVARATAAEYVSLRAESYLALGEVLRLAARPRDSAAALEQALHAYESKGFALSANAVRARLTALHASASG